MELPSHKVHLQHKHNSQNHLRVAGCTASAPPTTSIVVVICSSSVCSVGLRSVGSPGTVPDHA